MTGAKLNHPGLQKLQKARQLVPFGIDIHLESMGLFLYFLTEKMPLKDRAAFTKNIGLTKREIDLWQKLEGKAKKLEKDLKSAKLQKPSKVYQVLAAAPGDQILFLLAHSSERLVHDRIKNYLGKYLPTAQEVTDRDVLATGVKLGTPKFQKAREELILTRLDARPKKIPPPEERCLRQGQGNRRLEALAARRVQAVLAVHRVQAVLAVHRVQAVLAVHRVQAVLAVHRVQVVPVVHRVQAVPVARRRWRGNRDENQIATDERRSTPIRKEILIGVHLC